MRTYLQHGTVRGTGGQGCSRQQGIQGCQIQGDEGRARETGEVRETDEEGGGTDCRGKLQETAINLLGQAKAHANTAQLKEIEGKIKAADTEMNKGSLFGMMEQENQPEPSVQQPVQQRPQQPYTQAPVQEQRRPQQPYTRTPQTPGQAQPAPQRPQQAYAPHPQQPGILPPQQPPQPQARPQIQPHAQYVQQTAGQQPPQNPYPPQPEIREWQEERFMQEDEQQAYLDDSEHPTYSERDYEGYVDFPQSMLEPKHSHYQTF